MDSPNPHHPTLVEFPRLPVTVGLDAVHLSKEVHTLELPPASYSIRQDGTLWQVRRTDNLQLVYAGPGPVEVSISQAPF